MFSEGLGYRSPLPHIGKAGSIGFLELREDICHLLCEVSRNAYDSIGIRNQNVARIYGNSPLQRVIFRL